MGTAHILYLYDDALHDADADALANELGRALLTLTMHPDRSVADADEPQGITWHRVGSHGNALQWCGEVHSREVRVYLWAANCLRELRQLGEADLRELRAAVEREQARRKEPR